MTFSDGSVYDGYWQNDQIHGTGTMTTAENEKYEGEW